jgi:hypothetical protein
MVSFHSVQLFPFWDFSTFQQGSMKPVHMRCCGMTEHDLKAMSNLQDMFSCQIAHDHMQHGQDQGPQTGLNSGGNKANNQGKGIA